MYTKEHNMSSKMFFHMKIIKNIKTIITKKVLENFQKFVLQGGALNRGLKRFFSI